MLKNYDNVSSDNVSKSEKVRFTTNLDKYILHSAKVYAAKNNKNLNEIIEACLLDLLIFDDVK